MNLNQRLFKDTIDIRFKKLIYNRILRAPSFQFIYVDNSAILPNSI